MSPKIGAADLPSEAVLFTSGNHTFHLPAIIEGEAVPVCGFMPGADWNAKDLEKFNHRPDSRLCGHCAAETGLEQDLTTYPDEAPYDKRRTDWGQP